MDIKFSRDPKEPGPAVSSDRVRQNTLLAVLLILAAAFAYLYYFTGLITPQEARMPAEAPAPQIVKKPLPARSGEPAKDGTAGAPEARQGTAATAGTAPRKVAAAGTQEGPRKGENRTPEPARPSSPAVAENKPAAAGQQPAAAAKKPAVPEKKGGMPGAQEPKTAAAPKPAEKKPAPAAKEPPAAAAKKPVPAQGNGRKQVGTAPSGNAVSAAQAAKAAKTAAAAAKAPTAAPAGAAAVPAKKAPLKVASSHGAKTAAATTTGPWTVMAGSYVLEEAMATDLARVKGAGLEAAVKQGGRKKATMNRLLAGEYPTHAEAESKLEQLNHTTSDAFILKQGGTYAVYAGSYLLQDRANSEKERLAAAGIKLSLHRAQVYLPSKNLTVGTFSDKKAAEAVRRKLKTLGITAALSHP